MYSILIEINIFYFFHIQTNSFKHNPDYAIGLYSINNYFKHKFMIDLLDLNVIILCLQSKKLLKNLSFLNLLISQRVYWVIWV